MKRNALRLFIFMSCSCVLAGGCSEGLLSGADGFRGGDVVLMVDRRPIPSVRDFSNAMKRLRTGKFTVKVWREQEPKVFTFNK